MNGRGAECKQILVDALSNLRGETSQIEQGRFHLHIENCESCRDSVEVLSELVETTRCQRFLPTQQQRDNILANLFEEIGTGSTKNQVPGVRKRWNLRRWFYAAVPVAAAALFVLVAVWGISDNVSEEGEKRDIKMVATMTREEESLPLDRNTLLPQTPENKYLADGLTVGVQPGSRFGFKENENQLILSMEKGHMWIKYSPPVKRRKLVVQGAGVDVYVVGTVLMVRAKPGEVMEVGVYEGQVLVKPDVGESISLDGEQLRFSDGRVEDMDGRLLKLATNWLGNLRLRGGADSAPITRQHPDGSDSETERSEIESGRSGPKQTASNVEDLYSAAEHKMSEGNYKVAAHYLEKLISGHPRSARADTARLDLGRLYSGPLKNPSRAVYHFKTYLKRHPTGSRSRLVADRLCEIEKKSAIDVKIDCEN